VCPSPEFEIEVLGTADGCRLPVAEFENLKTAKVIRDRKSDGVESNACIRWTFDLY
jgi:hypothetical protein